MEWAEIELETFKNIKKFKFLQEKYAIKYSFRTILKNNEKSNFKEIKSGKWNRPNLN
jgi:hypothetical protein